MREYMIRSLVREKDDQGTWMDRMCPADDEQCEFETQAIERLYESVQELAFLLDRYQHQKSIVLSAHRYLHQDQIPRSLQRRIDFLFQF